MVICPDASSDQNSIAAVSAEGRTVWVLIRRLNSSCSRSMAFVVGGDLLVQRLGGVREQVSMLVHTTPLRRHLGPERCQRALQTRAILEAVGLAHRADAPVEVLPYGDLRRLEIARALATGPRLLLLDEPFAGLGAIEIEPISALIRRLHASEGLTILLIEHRLRVFMQMVSRVIAMDFGRVIASGTPADIVRHPRVIEAYIGRDDEVSETGEPPAGEPRGAA